MAHSIARWLAKRLLSLEGQGSSPEVMLMAKLLALCWLITGHALYVPQVFLPFWGALDALPLLGLWWLLLLLCGLAGVAGILLSYRLRGACVLLAAVIFASTLASRIYFSNNRLFCACLFLLLGLTPKGQSPLLVRYQVILLYLGASLDKLLDADWRSGQFMESFVRRMADFGTLWSPSWRIGAPNPFTALYLQVAEALPPMMLSWAVSWLTIAAELSLALLFWRGCTRLAVGVGIIFHSGLLFLTGSTMGMFFYAALISYLAFIEWPTSVSLEAPPRWRWFCALLRCEHHDGERLALRLGSEARAGGGHAVLFGGSAALIRALWCSPTFYFLMVLLLAGPWFRPWLVLSLLSLLPLLRADRRATPAPSAPS